MTERAISYLLLLTATVAVLLVVIIQPRNTLLQKQRMLQGINPNLANTCITSSGAPCEQSPLNLICQQMGGTWNTATQSCDTPPTMCGNIPCDEQLCSKMGHGWNGTSCVISSSNNGVGGILMDDSGISQKIGERIESKCLDHLAVSNVNGNGYEQLFQKYGWFDAVRNPTVQACKRAYLATIGKYGTDALQGIGKLLMNDDAVPKKDYEISGLLYKALEDTCGKKELSIEETLDSKKERSIAKYLTDVLDIMTKFHSVTSNSPAYLANPVPHVMQTDSAILSLEKQFAELAAACLPPKIEILKAETIPTEKEKLRGMWHLDESMGTSIDSSENRNHLTQVKGAPVYSVTGKFNTALQFNGNSKRFINDNEQINLGITGPLTIDAWIYRTAPTTAQEGIITKWNEAGDNRSYALTINEANHLTLHLSDATQIETSIIGDTTIPSNTWVHVAGVYDGSSMYVFQNGIIVGKKAYTKGIANKNAFVSIGGAEKLGGGDAFFNGKIDDARISGDALWINNFTVEEENSTKDVKLEGAPLSQRAQEFLIIFESIATKLKGIRSEPITQKTISVSINRQMELLEELKELLGAFNACLKKNECSS